MRRQLEAIRAHVTAADGIVVVDKPAGFTSHDVVGAMRRLAATRKVGHAGTLDPMATGVLILGIGKATRLLHYITGADKTYTATVVLGVATDSDDADGQVIETNGCGDISEVEIDQAIRALTGTIEQVPATVSAIKVGGKRAHALHRNGQSVTLQARSVTVSRFERTSPLRTVVRSFAQSDTVETIEFDVEVECSSGTYVRCLARDLGTMMGTGGHLSALRRTRVGKWTINEATTIDACNAVINRANRLEPPAALDTISLTDACTKMFDVLDLTAAEARALSFGNATTIEPRTSENVPIAAIYDGRVQALIELQKDRYRPLIVFEVHSE
ncbi:MAG: tRNA pseudouridine(55) synthase TruB [Actinomycetaceae bacterium]|nr:tRNA pseudouridine(55) synthase TruB [Actinomycetaceae bacterium]